MAGLLEALFFIAPMAAFVVWRRYYPDFQPGLSMVIGVLVVVALAWGAVIWWGLSRSMDRDLEYVAPRFENGRLLPGHAEPRR